MNLIVPLDYRWNRCLNLSLGSPATTVPHWQSRVRVFVPMIPAEGNVGPEADFMARRRQRQCTARLQFGA